MRSYLIDPVAETIEQIDFSGDYRDIYKLLEIGGRPFTVVQLRDRDCVYVDDEGLLNDPRYFFKLTDYPQPLAGRGLVLGTDREGESIAPKMTLDQLRQQVSFEQHSVQGFIVSEENIDHPIFGPMRRIKNEPVFGPPEKENRQHET